MRKRISTLSAFFLCALCMTGCVKTTEYSEEQFDIISTYIAQAVIEHDKNMSYNLVDLDDDVDVEDDNEDIVVNDPDDDQKDDTDNKPEDDIQDNTTEDDKDNESEDNAADDKPDKDNNSTAVSDASINEVLSLKDIDIEYKKYKVMNEYLVDEVFSVIPDKGTKLIVTYFDIKNVSGKDVNVELIPDGIVFTLEVSGKAVKPLLTAAPTELLYYSDSIKKEKSKEAVLIFQTEDISNKDSVFIKIKSDKGTYTKKIK